MGYGYREKLMKKVKIKDLEKVIEEKNKSVESKIVLKNGDSRV